MITISKTIKNNAPQNALFFSKCKKAVLGDEYELSLVFIANKLSRKLNRTHRNIDKPTDILSFPLDKKAGEIFINIPYSQKKCLSFDRKFDNYIRFLFIHGLFHLKGYEHSSRMESEEQKMRKKFNV